jgi:hypothetical protein
MGLGNSSRRCMRCLQRVLALRSMVPGGFPSHRVGTGTSQTARPGRPTLYSCLHTNPTAGRSRGSTRGRSSHTSPPAAVFSQSGCTTWTRGSRRSHFSRMAQWYWGTLQGRGCGTSVVRALPTPQHRLDRCVDTTADASRDSRVLRGDRVPPWRVRPPRIQPV